MVESKIEVRGIRQLQSALKKIDSELAGELKVSFRKIAETVVSHTQSKVPHRSGRAASSIKAKSSSRGASIAVGGTAAPYYPFLDFGGSTGRGHSPGRAGSGVIKRSFIQGGRYLYPTIAADNQHIKEEVDNVLERLAKSAGFETTGGV